MKNVPAELQNVRLPSSRQAQNLNIIDILSAMKNGDSLLSPYAFSGAWGSLRMGSCC